MALCSEGGRDICGKEGGLDLVVRSLWSVQSDWECRGAPQDPLLLGSGTPQSFHTSCEIWRVMGRVLSWGQAMNYKLERKHRWAKVQPSSGDRMEPVLLPRRQK